MRKSPYIRTMGALLLGSGLVVSAATTASAETAPDVSSPAQLAAMERDLGLTTAEATELLTAQDEALATEAELTEALGSAFGGAVFDTATSELTVSVTDASAVDTVRAAGAEARVVDHGEATLDDIVATLDDSAPAYGEGVHGWYVDLADDSVVITVAEGATASAEELVADTGVDASAVTVEESADAPETFAQIIGGNAYTINSSSRCSIGFAVSGGFVTAGHCGSVGASVASSDGRGTVRGSIFPGRDMGWVGNVTNWTSTPYVNNYSGGTVTVTGSTEAATGASICRSGSTTGWHCGSIQSKNATVTYPQGTVTGLTRTNVCAEPGDSGGSWVSGSQAQGVTSGGSGNCRTGGTTFYQPVNPILSQWGLTLTRG
ncbi:S1 family peptidase [Nocardiopsis mangrovi]|uniref:S1 family peptidase n=1 Tax=Nocardiopsis mangrovi TaxID=1179818 RepID=A0ABV9DY20_9ACTN